MSAEHRLTEARELYERSVFGDDHDALPAADRALDAVEADLALARGRVVHARFLRDRVEDPAELPLFSRAAQLYQQLGDGRGEGEALFWIGCFHQVVRQDDDAAVPALQRARALASAAGDRRTQASVLRHLGIAAHRAGRLDEAREHLEASVRLREELGHHAGVAANLVGLAYVAAADGRPDEVPGLLERAERLAAGHGAAAVTRQVGEARQALDYDRAS
ncbi:tetratricopeptide repeat protein [Dactylosporangium aurantiacum]|uniref:Tetratricopeptide repeat protein n=1 Tax=Dactylosporangium aurantiacum TaxID=35754 RepID=A0A9Q9IIK9_9ACTN|nr:tetratricopeptide repeat protein [Dactylosporangium aurantiacum]MDG6104222.1 tetratricopeptide repeat protein [Dactylosporangium aurantiacum]UWZ56777.1 tetratricopeptide repeat protein [Dactylosporangium aurantiacum]